MRAQLVRIQDAAGLMAVGQAMVQDAHLPVYPSHAVVRDNKIIGSAAICTAPLVVFWMDSRQAHAKDSVIAIKACEDAVAQQGYPDVYTLCWKGSPFHKHLTGHFGYDKIWETEIFHKALKK